MGNRAALTLTHINVKELQKEKSVKISELSSPSSSSGHQREFSMEVHLCQNYVSIATLCVDWLSFRLWTALQFWLNTFCFLPLNVWFQKLGCRFWQFDHHCKQLVQNSFIIMGIFKNSEVWCQRLKLRWLFMPLSLPIRPSTQCLWPKVRVGPKIKW